MTSKPYLIPEEWIAPALGLAAGMFFFVFNVTGFSLEYFAGDLGDGRLNLYFLEHAYQYFTGKVGNYWDAPFMVPEPNVIAFSDNLLGTAPLYSLFRAWGADQFFAYQLWFISITAFNYCAAYLLLRYILPNAYACAVGAMVFAFSMALYSQLTHAQTFPRFAIPLAFLMALIFRQRYEVKYFFFTLLFLVYQIYCGIYMGFMLAIPLALMLFFIIREVKWGAALKGDSRMWWIKMVLSVVANVAILMPLMWPYMQRGFGPGIRHYREIIHHMPTLKSYVCSVNGSFAWPKLSELRVDSPAFYDHQIFSGALATLAFLVASFLFFKAFRKKDPWSAPLLMMAVALLTFFIYLRVEKVSAYFLIYFLPGFSSIRALGRIINVELIFFGLALAWLLVPVFSRFRRFRIPLFIALMGLWLTDNYVHVQPNLRTSVHTAQDRLAPYDDVFSTLPKGSIFSLEPREKLEMEYVYQLDAMLLAQKYGLRTVNAYTGSCPPKYAAFWQRIDAEGRNAWLNAWSLPPEELYVITGHKEYHVQNVNVGTSHPEAKSEEVPIFRFSNETIAQKMSDIRADTAWYGHIQAKAAERGLPVEAVLREDAIWALEQE